MAQKQYVVKCIEALFEHGKNYAIGDITIMSEDRIKALGKDVEIQKEMVAIEGRILRKSNVIKSK